MVGSEQYDFRLNISEMKAERPETKFEEQVQQGRESLDLVYQVKAPDSESY